MKEHVRNNRLVLGALVLILWVAAARGAVRYRFDCGPPGSPVKAGFTALGVESAYSAARGFGWEKPPTEAFDRPKPFQQPVENIPADDLQRDGVAGADDIVFRLDLPNGEYWLRAWIGDTRDARVNMCLAANGTEIAANVDTFPGWGGSATERAIRARVRVSEGALRLRFYISHQQGDEADERNSILGLEVIEWQPLPVMRKEGRLVADGFTAAAFADGAAAYERGALDAAEKHFSRLSGAGSGWVKAAALLWVAGHLDYPEPRRLVLQVRDSLAGLCAKEPGNTVAEQLLLTCDLYLTAREWIAGMAYSQTLERTGINRWRRLAMADDRLEQVLPDEPLYHRALLDIGRICYWKGRETGEQAQYDQAAKRFALLREAFPGNRLVRMYTGQQVEWGTEYREGTAGAPEWAVAAREALARSLDVLHWWIQNRQQPNGEMGGGFGDDVELLRTWSFAQACVDDDIVRQGWRRLAEGVWHSGEIEDGYSKELGDVQHSAEDVSDSQPALIGWEYGDPTYVERCMQTMRLFRDLWTGVNSFGHRHFMSDMMSASEIMEGSKHGVDLAYHARAAKPGLWVAWYNGNPEIKRLLAEWGDAWVEDTRRADNGKPAGILPAAIAYDTERLGGYGPNWWDPDLYWSYFVFPGGTSAMFEHLVGVWQITGNEKYLEPMHSAMNHILALPAGRSSKDPDPGSLEWAARRLAPNLSHALARWRALTGDTRYDSYLAEHGVPYARWLATRDKTHLVAGCRQTIEATKHNFEMLTSEVLFTDRVSLPGTDHLFSMYTGGAGIAAQFPSYAVTWSGVTKNFAALVLNADGRRVKVLAHNFEPHPQNARMRLWRLQPGTYRLRVGDDRNHDDAADSVREAAEFRLGRRGDSVVVTLPSRVLQVIEIEQLQATADPGPLPDLAFGPDDVRILDQDPVAGESVAVAFTVHNLGAADARDAWVHVYDGEAKPENLIIKRLVSKMHGADSLTPRHFTEVRRWVATAGEHVLTFIIDPDDQVAELNEGNNRAVLRVTVR